MPRNEDLEPGQIIHAVQTRILQAPQRPVPPGEHPGLITLRCPQRGRVQPTFQFEPTGRPYAVVVRINRLLLANVDPWGVADWWLSPNSYLGNLAPQVFLGRETDGSLMAAARALVED